MKTFADLIIKLRIPVIIGFVAITVLFAMQIPKSEIDPDVKNYMPKDIHSRVNNDAIEEMFGGTDMFMILFEHEDILNPKTLKRVKNVSKKINRIKGVDKVFSLFDLKSIKGEDGAMIVNPAVKRIPKNNKDEAKLKQELIDNDLVYEIVVDKDFKLTAIIASIEEGLSDEFLVGRTKEILEEFPGDEEVHLGGMPFTRVSLASDIQGDMSKLMPIGLLIMLVFLFIAFKQLRGVFLPFIVVMMSIIVAMGSISLIGWKITMTSVLVPVFLIAVANDYGIHLIAKFQEDNTSENKHTNKELSRRIFLELYKPVLLTGLTTMAGVLCLLTHIIIPAKQIGVLAAIGILFALVASLVFIPAVTSLLPVPKPIFNGKESKHFLDKLLNSFGRIVVTNPKKVLFGFILISLVTSYGIFLVDIDANPENYYPDDHPIIESANIVNNKFGGSSNIAIVINGDIKSPEIMHKIENYEAQINSMEEIGNTSSIARVVKQMSRALNDSTDEYYNRIPQSRNAIAQYFELYNMSGDPEDFEKLLDFNYENALIVGRINTQSTPKTKRLVNRVEELTKDDPNVTYIGGWGMIFSEFADLVVNGQIYSLLLSVIVVAILMMIFFKSFIAGVLSSVPILMAMVILFGLMGYFGIELNIATAMLSSIMIGVGIDYTIHFLWRYKEERGNGLNYEDAIQKTLFTSGRGITFNALSVIIGFTALLISTFLPVRFFGFLVFVSIFACLLGALVLIPSLALIFKPKFLEPKTEIGE